LLFSSDVFTLEGLVTVVKPPPGLSVALPASNNHAMVEHDAHG